MIVLIPAYEPDERLLKLIRELKAACSYNIVIVDDGSGETYSSIFRSAKILGCTVLTHKTNRGKGCALKTGFKYAMKNNEREGVVCADCDGQHLPEDIIRIANQIGRHKSSIILGCRRFTGKVPMRSMFGNTVTRMIFSFATGVKVHDTQTGLRGFSSDMLDWLCSIPGERFEYEMNMLLDAPETVYPFYEVDINTVYSTKNKSSHFRTISDSARVYLPILKFSASSLISGIIDFSLLVIIQNETNSLVFSVAGARICSSICNYIMNKFFVFSNRKNTRIRDSAPKYFSLVLLIMILNYGLIYTYNKTIGIPLFAAKLLTEFTIYLFSYWSQRKYVFC